jgi:hypothetical protein
MAENSVTKPTTEEATTFESKGKGKAAAENVHEDSMMDEDDDDDDEDEEEVSPHALYL